VRARRPTSGQWPGGQDILVGLFADAIRAAGPSATTVDCLAAAWSPSPSYSPRSANDVAPQRRAAIAANSELQERELLKRARLASAIADALYLDLTGATGAMEASARTTSAPTLAPCGVIPESQ
jgi:hypothetical protein